MKIRFELDMNMIGVGMRNGNRKPPKISFSFIEYFFNDMFLQNLAHNGSPRLFFYVFSLLLVMVMAPLSHRRLHFSLLYWLQLMNIHMTCQSSLGGHCCFHELDGEYRFIMVTVILAVSLRRKLSSFIGFEASDTFGRNL